ncbi:glycosyltransferase [Bifidobacterium dolichotidis]|nr:glycosyltransferase [Bifidobacterium dolichotidis]
MTSHESTTLITRAWYRTAWLMVVGVVLAVLAEIVVFNLPYWRTIGASTDSDTAITTTGSGLERMKNGAVKVTDARKSYFEVHQDGSSEYLRVESLKPDANYWSGTYGTVHLRVEPLGNGCTSSYISVSPLSQHSMYVKVPQCNASTVRVWIQEPAGSKTRLTNVRANVTVPFSFDWARVLTMLIIWALIVLWIPGSPLWRTQLNTHSWWQRLALLAIFGVVIWYAVARVRHALMVGTAPALSTPHQYTFDFNQYGYVADALLHGRTWLDLPVPDALAQSASPHDIATRTQLIKDGVNPIYWDFAFYNGHWYSYFGVIPAVLLFLPFQLITSIWIPGGMMLPAAAAEPVFMTLYTVFAVLFAMRLLKRVRPHITVAAATMLTVAFMLGSDALYFWYRVNFYSIPISCGLFLLMLGMWLWLGATKDENQDKGQAKAEAETEVEGNTKAKVEAEVQAQSKAARFPRRGIWKVEGAQPLSLPHVAGGALCIAATFGCRPTFALAALLGIAIFWPQLRALWVARHVAGSGRLLAHIVIAVFVPALIVTIPVLMYNYVRFGSLFDFGNAYQMTVADMTTFRSPAQNILPTIFYYLLLPLRFESQFPFLALSPTPLPAWSYTEPCIGGLLCFMPLATLAFVAPFMHRKIRATGLSGLIYGSLTLAVVLLVFDTVVGGFSWRYMADFGWLLMIAAICVAAIWCQKYRLGRWVVFVAVIFALVIAALSCFTIGREDSLIANETALYHSIQSWVSLL